jgi:peroxisomal membrane protein 4
MSGLPDHLANKHPIWDPNWIVSAARGFRNGIVIGARSRLPYLFQAAAYVLVYSDDGLKDRLRSVVKMMFVHGYNLGSFVVIYKTICAALRSVNINGGIESLIAGFIGGYHAFGESKGMSGTVNTQLVLYLLARAVQGTVQKGVQQKLLPSYLDWGNPTGFRVWAGITLALALYHTEYSAT